jgi:uncharacterized protein YhfF
MKLIPILFSNEMVNAIQDNRKSQTRREVKPQPDIDMPIKKVPMYSELEEHWNKYCITDINGEDHLIKCPYGQPGDILWVRESWMNRSPRQFHLDAGSYIYKAGWDGCTDAGWKPSIHMPFEAARIFLRVKEIKVERLQDISEEDAKAEGIEVSHDYGDGNFAYKNYDGDSSVQDWEQATISFQTIWHSINGAESWNANPFVWVIKFERVAASEISDLIAAKKAALSNQRITKSSNQ